MVFFFVVVCLLLSIHWAVFSAFKQAKISSNLVRMQFMWNFLLVRECTSKWTGQICCFVFSSRTNFHKWQRLASETFERTHSSLFLSLSQTRNFVLLFHLFVFEIIGPIIRHLKNVSVNTSWWSTHEMITWRCNDLCLQGPPADGGVLVDHPSRDTPPFDGG